MVEKKEGGKEEQEPESPGSSTGISTETQPEFLLDVDPGEEIRFRGPFGRPVTVDLKVRNGTEHAMASKVKCTNNSLFKIKPAISIIPPKETIIYKITATLKNGKPPKGSVHHFLVTYTDADPSKNARDVWKEALEAGKTKFAEKRMKVVFEESPVGAHGGGADAPNATA